MESFHGPKEKQNGFLIREDREGGIGHSIEPDGQRA